MLPVHALARQSTYFYWNGYCLIFLITVVSFCIFGIPPQLVVSCEIGCVYIFRFSLAANRIQIACTLLLTSITFRWTVNRSLVSVAGPWNESRMHQLSFLSLADHLLFNING